MLSAKISTIVLYRRPGCSTGTLAAAWKHLLHHSSWIPLLKLLAALAEGVTHTIDTLLHSQQGVVHDAHTLIHLPYISGHGAHITGHFAH